MPTEIEIQITPLFSTPLLVFTPADHERINAKLSALILEREASIPTHRDAEVVGWSSPHDLSMLEWAGEPLRDLFAPVMEVAKQVTTLSQRCDHGHGRPDWDVVEVWANVQRNGGANEERCGESEGKVDAVPPRGEVPRRPFQPMGDGSQPGADPHGKERR